MGGMQRGSGRRFTVGPYTMGEADYLVSAEVTEEVPIDSCTEGPMYVIEDYQVRPIGVPAFCEWEQWLIRYAEWACQPVEVVWSGIQADLLTLAAVTSRQEQADHEWRRAGGDRV